MVVDEQDVAALRRECVDLAMHVLELRAQGRAWLINAAGFPTGTSWWRLIHQTYDQRYPLDGTGDDETAIEAVRRFAAERWGITPDRVRRLLHEREAA